MAAGKRFAVVVNPRGGKRQGQRVLQRMQPLFEQAGARLIVRFTERAGDAVRLAQNWDLEGYDGLCAIGGDGTVHEVVNGLLARGDPPPIPLGLIPAGTGNTLHRDMQCVDPRTSVEAILCGRTRRLDVARVRMGTETVYCINIVGWGAVADINRTAENLRPLGPMRYSAAALWELLTPKQRQARIFLDDEPLEGEFLFVIGCNTQRTGTGMLLAPGAKIDDGKIDVVVLRPASRRNLFAALRRVLRGHPLELPEMLSRQVSTFTVEAAGGEPLNLDGEAKGTAPMVVEMMPGALQVFCPR